MNKIIDRFRDVAVIMIVMCHYAQTYYDLPNVVRIIIGMGQMGCQIFFVMSAFACFLSIDKKKYDYKTFLKRRLMKILPSYWGDCIIPNHDVVWSCKGTNCATTHCS